MAPGTSRSVIALALVAAASVPSWAQPASEGGRAAQTVNGTVDLSTPTIGKYKRTIQSPQIFETLGYDEGLPQSYVRDIIQDQQGFLWIATQGGLARYDGYQMRVFAKKPDDPHALTSSFTTAIELATDGKLWIGTGEAGVSVYDPNTDTLTHYQAPGGDAEGAPSTPPEQTVSSNGILDIEADAAGNIWIGADDGALSKFDQATGTFQHVQIFRDLETSITTLAQGEGKYLWVGTVGGGLFRFDTEAKKVAHHYLAGSAPDGLTSNAIRVVYRDHEGMIWVGTDSGLNRIDPRNDSIKHYQHRADDRQSLSDDRVTVIYEDRDNTLWVGTEDGLSVMDDDRRVFTQYRNDPADMVGTSSYPIHLTAIYQDRGGVLWFGSQGGLRKLQKLRMEFNPRLNVPGENDNIPFVEGKSGIIWTGNYNTGLQKIDRKAGTVLTYTRLGGADDPDAIRLAEWITTLFIDSRGILWLSGNGLGLIGFDPETEEYEQYLPDPDNMTGPTAARIERILEDPDGYLWLATWGGGLNRFDPETEEFLDFLKYEEDPSSLSSDHLYTVHLDNQDSSILWVGTSRGGLNMFSRETQTATRYHLVPEGSEQLGYDTITCIHQESDGTLWLGTDGAGLVKFDPKSGHVEYLSDVEALANTTIYGILPDDNGRLWMSTSDKGLIVLNPENGETISYRVGDGLASPEFIQNGYYRSSTGEMFFGAIGGYNVFHPDKIAPDPYAPAVIVSGFQIFNKEAELEKPIWTLPNLDLGYTDSVFSFEFTAPSFAAPEGILYAYKLDGLHDWVETNRRFVTYTNLSGGEYVFRVKARNHHGTWSEVTTALELHVDAPPWKTWWAYMIYGLTGLGIVFGYLRYQARKVESLQKAHRLETVERELELTGAVQSGFLPKANQVGNSLFGLYGFYRPADQAGGDWWWYEEADSKLTILVGDVTGHGAGPAMVTAAAATAFRIQGKNKSLTLAERLEGCNEEVLRVGGGSYQMTMSAVELDGRTGRFAFYSAGGLPIMRVRYDGRPRTLLCSGTPLGSENFSVGKVEGTMNPGERMIIYTDGIPEMPVGPNRQLGMRRFSMVCESTEGLSLAEAAQRVVMVSDAIRQNAPQEDDWTFALLEWSGGKGASQSVGAPQSAGAPRVPQEETQDWAAMGLDGEGVTKDIDAWAEPSKFEDGTVTNPGGGGRSGGGTPV